MIVGEVANFVAYIYAPAVLVTPLGALSIIVRYVLKLYDCCYRRWTETFLVRLVDFSSLTHAMNRKSAVLAHFMLKERLQQMGILGCVSCIVGSVVIVLHAPEEHTPGSVQEVWKLATEPGSYLFAPPPLASLSISITFKSSYCCLFVPVASVDSISYLRSSFYIHRASADTAF